MRIAGHIGMCEPVPQRNGRRRLAKMVEAVVAVLEQLIERAQFGPACAQFDNGIFVPRHGRVLRAIALLN
jgi:hypothetical protein